MKGFSGLSPLTNRRVAAYRSASALRCEAEGKSTAHVEMDEVNAGESTNGAAAEDDDLVLIRPPPEARQGDVISPHRAVLTLSKSMFNAGCFSLPYAWKLGGKWMSFALTILIAGFNWYGNHILVRSSQHLAKRSGVSCLDYGHFAKRVCDYSSVTTLKVNSKAIMYIVNVTILFYQLGMCSVAILFIADNLVHLVGSYVGGSEHFKMVVMATAATIFILGTNMWTEMRVISVFAMISSIFFILGTVVIMQYTVQQPSQWSSLPSYTNFTDTAIFIGMSMYAFEGQTMILPVENKLEHPQDFIDNFGVLPTTMCLCTLFMIAIGFYGYNGFGESIQSTITVNVPLNGLYSSVNIFLMIQSMLGHSIAMYVVFGMFLAEPVVFKNCATFFDTVKVVDKGFRSFWVIITYLMAILIPKLEVMIPLVGVTSGTLCALIYPPFFQLVTFWDDWKANYTPVQRALKISINVTVILIGFFAIGAGVTAPLMKLL